MLNDYVASFLQEHTIRTGNGRRESYPIIALRVFQTDVPWRESEGISFENFIKGRKDIFRSFEKKAHALLNKEQKRVFWIPA